ncbi:MAG: hypothetical protein RIT24_214 [Planctomycetota bacterium]
MPLAALAVSLALSAPPAPFDPAPFDPAPFNHVLVISVDGLRSDCLEAPSIELLPNFARLLAGPHTLDARTDSQVTVTLPNQVSTITGRTVFGPYGHNWTHNSDPPDIQRGGTLHINKGAYITSMFDVAHDAGISTTCHVSKAKFWLLQQSYGWSTGAPDTTGEDNGLAKIDAFHYIESNAALGAAVAGHLQRATKRTLDFVHFAAPDSAGHSYDWIVKPDSKYFAAVKEVDAALGVILKAIEEDPDLRGRTALVLTADHGGGVPRKTHTDMTCPLNFRIPFLVWLGEGRQAADLLALNPNRLRPGREEIGARDATAQPIRNGDAANVAMSLLGLPAIPGSFYGANERLRLTAP